MSLQVKINGIEYKAIEPTSKYLGMMFRDFQNFDIMVFEDMNPRISIWTPFCPTIDMIFVKDNRVVKLILDIPPWKNINPRVNYDTLLECNINARISVAVGDKIEIIK